MIASSDRPQPSRTNGISSHISNPPTLSTPFFYMHDIPYQYNHPTTPRTHTPHLQTLYSSKIVKHQTGMPSAGVFSPSAAPDATRVLLLVCPHTSVGT